MSLGPPRRAARGVASVVVAGALALGGAACSGDGDDAGPTTTTTAPLTPFTAEDARFKALFPSPPTRSDQQVPTAQGELRLVQYTSEVGSDYGFSIGWFQLAAPPEGVRPFLESTQRGSLTAVEGELTASAFIEVQGSPAIEYSATLKGGGHLKARTVLVGRDVYVLQLVGSTATLPRYDELMAGFAVLPPA